MLDVLLDNVLLLASHIAVGGGLVLNMLTLTCSQDPAGSGYWVMKVGAVVLLGAGNCQNVAVHRCERVRCYGCCAWCCRDKIIEAMDDFMHRKAK